MIKFKKDFYQGNADGFTPSGGTWAVVPSPNQYDILNRYRGAGNGLDAPETNNSLFSDTTTNYKCRFQFQCISGTEVGFFTRFVDVSNLMIFMFNGDAGLNVLKIEAGVPTIIASSSVPAYSSGVHTVDFNDTGTHITIKLDNITYIDSDYTITGVSSTRKGFVSNMSSITDFTFVVVDDKISLIGDMNKAVYDVDENNMVDNSERLGGVLSSLYAKKVDSSDIEITDSTKGLILKSATRRWRVKVDDLGVLSTEEVL